MNSRTRWAETSERSLLERLLLLRSKHSPERTREQLAAELEIGNPVLLDQLLALGVTPETAPAFEALPLVEVAWADGSVDEEERWTALQAATAFGLELGTPAHAQLELWLSRRPDPALFEAFYDFASRRQAQAGTDGVLRRLLEEAHAVADAAGGLLGFGKVSRSERAVIDRIARLSRHGPHPRERD